MLLKGSTCISPSFCTNLKTKDGSKVTTINSLERHSKQELSHEKRTGRTPHNMDDEWERNTGSQQQPPHGSNDYRYDHPPRQQQQQQQHMPPHYRHTNEGVSPDRWSGGTPASSPPVFRQRSEHVGSHPYYHAPHSSYLPHYSSWGPQPPPSGHDSQPPPQPLVTARSSSFHQQHQSPSHPPHYLQQQPHPSQPPPPTYSPIPHPATYSPQRPMPAVSMHPGPPPPHFYSPYHPQGPHSYAPEPYAARRGSESTPYAPPMPPPPHSYPYGPAPSAVFSSHPPPMEPRVGYPTADPSSGAGYGPPPDYVYMAPDPNQEATPDTVIVHVQDDDVLCGRGAPTTYHPGNQYFKELVTKYQATYIASRRSDKPQIAMQIVQIIRERGGRFLKRTKKTGMGPSGHFCWEDVGDQRAYEKACQALRENAPELRRRLATQELAAISTDSDQTRDVSTAIPRVSDESRKRSSEGLLAQEPHDLPELQEPHGQDSGLAYTVSSSPEDEERRKRLKTTSPS